MNVHSGEFTLYSKVAYTAVNAPDTNYLRMSPPIAGSRQPLHNMTSNALFYFR